MRSAMKNGAQHAANTVAAEEPNITRGRTAFADRMDLLLALCDEAMKQSALMHSEESQRHRTHTVSALSMPERSNHSPTAGTRYSVVCLKFRARANAMPAAQNFSAKARYEVSAGAAALSGHRGITHSESSTQPSR